MRPKDVAKLTGITVRTLQYYDKIGLLKPSETLENGYRNYHAKDLETLQQILFFRELDFPLSQIKEIMTDPNYDRLDALEHHKKLLQLKRDRLNELIKLVDTTIKGDSNMNFDAFSTNEIDQYKDSYAKEVKERWGDKDSYKEYSQKTKNYNTEKWSTVTEGMRALIEGFAALRNTPPESLEAQKQVKAWQDYITQNYYTCTLPILSGLGLMYVQDERFQSNIDQSGVGTAQFMAKAIACYCKEKNVEE